MLQKTRSQRLQEDHGGHFFKVQYVESRYGIIIEWSLIVTVFTATLDFDVDIILNPCLIYRFNALSLNLFPISHGHQCVVFLCGEMRRELIYRHEFVSTAQHQI